MKKNRGSCSVLSRAVIVPSLSTGHEGEKLEEQDGEQENEVDAQQKERELHPAGHLHVGDPVSLC